MYYSRNGDSGIDCKMPFCCSPRLLDWISSRSLYSQAKEQLDKKQFQKALDCLNQIKQLRIQSVVGKSWEMFLVCSQQLNISKEQTLRELIEYQQIDDMNPKLMVQIGTLLFQLLRDSQAEAWLRKSVQLSPKDCQNYRQITEVLKKHKKISLIIQFAEMWQNQLPQSSEQLAKIGQIYDSIKECERAEAIFWNLLYYHPQKKQYYLSYLSNQRLKYIPNPTNAFKVIKKGKKQFGKDYCLLQQQALFYLIQGDLSIFVDIIKQCIRENGSVSREAYCLFIKGLLDLYQIDQAQKYAIMLAQQYQQDIFSRWQIARTQFLLGNFQSYENITKNMLQRYERQGSSKPENIVAIFRIYCMKNNISKAIQMVELYHQLDKQTFQRDFFVIDLAANCYQQSRDIEKQCQYLRLLLRKQQLTVQVTLRLARLQNYKGNRQECLKILDNFKQALNEFTVNQKACYLELLLQLGLDKEGLQFYQIYLISNFTQNQSLSIHIKRIKLSILCLITNDYIEEAFQLFIQFEQICRAHAVTHVVLREISAYMKLLDFSLFFGRLGVFQHYSKIISDIFNKMNGLYYEKYKCQFSKLMENFKKQQTLLKTENAKIDEMTPN